MPPETRHQFRDELQRIEVAALEGLDMVADALERATSAVDNQDARLASLVIADDDRIDGRYLEVHQAILSLIAREAPVATDLRTAAAILHTVRHVERMGDQCVNICKLVPLSGHEPPVHKDILDRLDEMSRLLRLQILDAKRCFQERNMALAEIVARGDAEINRLNREIFQVALEIGTDFDTREWAMYMMLVARCLERIGDNAVDICEHVTFVVTGLFREFSDSNYPEISKRSGTGPAVDPY
jgi:phosphate transport system protein